MPKYMNNKRMGKAKYPSEPKKNLRTTSPIFPKSASPVARHKNPNAENSANAIPKSSTVIKLFFLPAPAKSDTPNKISFNRKLTFCVFIVLTMQNLPIKPMHAILIIN